MKTPIAESTPMTMQRRIRHYSDARLHKELAFAIGFQHGKMTAGERVWLAILKAEAQTQRRSKVDLVS